MTPVPVASSPIADIDAAAPLDDHLALVTGLVFRAGMGDAVVAAKWHGFLAAFDGMRCEDVAALTPADVARLLGDARIIRNRRKVEATVANAGALLDIAAADERGIAGWLAGLPDGDGAVRAVRRRFRHLGPTGAAEYLWRTGTRPSPTGCAR